MLFLMQSLCVVVRDRDETETTSLSYLQIDEMAAITIQTVTVNAGSIHRVYRRQTASDVCASMTRMLPLTQPGPVGSGQHSHLTRY